MKTGDKKTCSPQTGETPAQKAKQSRADRLSMALRDNLRRRKIQARARKSIDIATDKSNQTNKNGK